MSRLALSALEAAQYNIPCVLSKQSGAAEVMPHTLQSDYWDTDKMVDYLYALLHYSGLRKLSQKKQVRISCISIGKFQLKSAGCLFITLVNKLISKNYFPHSYPVCLISDIPTFCAVVFSENNPRHSRWHPFVLFPGTPAIPSKTLSFYRNREQHFYEDYQKNKDILDKVATKCYLPTNQKMLELISTTQR